MARKLFASLQLFATAVAFMYVSAESEKAGKLDMTTLNPEKIEGVYHSSKGGGIQFVSEAVGESHNLRISTLSGELLMSVKRQSPVVTLMTVMGRQFLIFNHTKGETERSLAGYVVPADFSQRLSESLKNEPVSDTLKMLQDLEFKTAGATRNAAMEELLERPEVEMIRGIVQEFAARKITGAENAPAMTMYVLAMRLSKFQNHKMRMESSLDQMSIPARRDKRGTCWWSWWTGERYCSNNDECCVRCPRGSNCLGMCGPGCDAAWYWWATCNTWCYQQGCYDHDICCNNWNSWGCQVTVGFTCSGYYCYSDATVPWA